MKIPLTEIAGFLKIVEEYQQDKNPENKKSEDEIWQFTLSAGCVKIGDISLKTTQSILNDQQFDTELITEVFTYREILWQPDVYQHARQCLSPLRILMADCQEKASLLSQNGRSADAVYSGLLQAIEKESEKALLAIESNPAKRNVIKALAKLRANIFPIIRFFIYHPKNKTEHMHDAINRLNYAAKVMITDFNTLYTELKEPYWQINLKKIKEPKTNLETKGS